MFLANKHCTIMQMPPPALQAAKTMYGPYVEAISVSVDSPVGAALAVRGVKTVVSLGRLGGLVAAAQKAGVEQVRPRLPGNQSIESLVGFQRCAWLGAWSSSNAARKIIDPRQPGARDLACNVLQFMTLSRGPANTCRATIFHVLTCNVMQFVALSQDSSAAGGFSLGGLFGGGSEDPAIRDAKREAELMASGIPCTVVRCPQVGASLSSILITVYLELCIRFVVPFVMPTCPAQPRVLLESKWHCIGWRRRLFVFESN